MPLDIASNIRIITISEANEKASDEMISRSTMPRRTVATLGINRVERKVATQNKQVPQSPILAAWCKLRLDFWGYHKKPVKALFPESRNPENFRKLS